MNTALKDGDLNFYKEEGHTRFFFFLMKQGIHRKRAYRHLGILPAMSQRENLCGMGKYAWIKPPAGKVQNVSKVSDPV